MVVELKHGSYMSKEKKKRIFFDTISRNINRKRSWLYTANGKNYSAFMAIELIYGDLEGITGTFHESPLYDVNLHKAKEFDALFPKK